MTVRLNLRRYFSIALASMSMTACVYSPSRLIAQEPAPQNSSQNNVQKSPQNSEQAPRERQTTKAPNERADDETPALGILTGSCPGKAVCVKGTIPYSPADEAGIEPGDYILSVDGKDVTSPTALKKLIESMKPDAQVTVKVWRQGEETDRKVQLASKAEQLPKGHDAWLGVMLASDEKGGVKIDHIVPGSPASDSELQEGDILVKVGNDEIKDAQTFIEKIEEMGPGDELKISIQRDGDARDLAVQLGSFGDAPMAFLRQLQMHHDNSVHGGQPHGGSDSTQLIDRALDDIRQQVRALRNEIRELKGEKEGKPANSKKDVSAVTSPERPKYVTQIQLGGAQVGNMRFYSNRGYFPGNNYYGGYNNGYSRPYSQGYGSYYGNNYGNAYRNNYGNAYGNNYYYRYGGQPYYYGGNSNWYGNRPRPGIQISPNAGIYWY